MNTYHLGSGLSSPTILATRLPYTDHKWQQNPTATHVPALLELLNCLGNSFFTLQRLLGPLQSQDLWPTPIPSTPASLHLSIQFYKGIKSKSSVTSVCEADSFAVSGNHWAEAGWDGWVGGVSHCDLRYFQGDLLLNFVTPYSQCSFQDH